MKPSHALAIAVLASGCPSSDHTLWLAPDKAETAVKLQDSQPGEY